MMPLFDEDWVLNQKLRSDMTHEDRVAFVRYIAMFSSRDISSHDIALAALCLPDTTLVSEAIAAAHEVSGGMEFIVKFRNSDIPAEEHDRYSIGDLSGLTMMI